MTKEQSNQLLDELREHCVHWMHKNGNPVADMETIMICNKEGGCSCDKMANETIIKGDVASSEQPDEGDCYDEDTGNYIGNLDISEGLPAQLSIFYKGYWYIFKPDSRYKHETIPLTDSEIVERQQP